ncbi:hypothetical protein GTV32_17975 [Gordonia sp. SID5947]|uniref:PLDc N-terminal domain-containing protein n=1 Tax=Gordonia sp. SID5947 TaxID=2690315 RepID=UPI00136AB0B8|nr:hypothetical protein [Gordonia sp. SID5947]MYR08072.1 hypothetical protein [Gordonia sp. SID5947]
MLLAEAGLSECARDAACSADFNRPFYIAFALLVLFSVWITVSAFATVDIISHRLDLQRSAIWLTVVWILPIIGVVAWMLGKPTRRVVDSCDEDVHESRPRRVPRGID